MEEWNGIGMNEAAKMAFYGKNEVFKSTETCGKE